MKVALADTVWGPHLVPANDVNVGLALLLYGEFSVSQAVALCKMLRPGDTAIDVGANIGALSLPMLKAVGPTGRVICFEPQPPLAKLLRATLALNAANPASYHVYNCALGAEPGELTVPPVDYNAEANNFGCVSLAADGKGARVPVETLDAVMAGMEPVRLIKIDVEGMETEVIAGARALLSRDRPILLVENDRGAKYLALIEQIEAIGYDCYWFLTPLFNPENAGGEKRDIYSLDCGNVDMICLPKGEPLPDCFPELPRATKEYAEQYIHFAQ